MTMLAGVQFTPSDKVQYFDANGISLSVGDRVIVETWDGEQEAVIVIASQAVPVAAPSTCAGSSPRPIRPATAQSSCGRT